MAEERELKLEFRAHDASRLKRSALFGTSKDRSSETLSSIYFDTPKHRLAREGFTLRVRKTGTGFVQTLKGVSQSTVGTHVRDEWEWPVQDQTPDLSLLSDTPLGQRVRTKSLKGKLSPVFETKVERTTRLITRGDAEVELALDEGTVVAGERSAPIRSLEFELKKGSPGALYDLASQLPKTAALDLDVRSKSERGYALLDDEPALSFKAEPIMLGDRTTAGEAARAIVKSCLRQFRLNVPGILEGGSSEALHQARVGLRRCRSALSFFEPVLADAEFERHATALRDLSRALGAARDLDVFLTGAEPPLPPDLQQKAVAERLRRYAALNAILTSPAHSRDILALAAWLDHGAWIAAEPSEQAMPVERFTAPRLDLWRRKVKKRGRDLGALQPHERHRCRIAAKKLRYVCEFLSSTAAGKGERKRFAAFVAVLESLQKDLGALNDRAFGSELLRTLAPELGHHDVPAESNRQVADSDLALVTSAEHAYHAFCRAKPFWS